MLQPDREVDARDLNCPLPILRTKKALNDMVPARRSGCSRRPRVGPGFPGLCPADRQRARRAGRGRRLLLFSPEAQMSSSLGAPGAGPAVVAPTFVAAPAAPDGPPMSAALLVLPDFLLIAVGALLRRAARASTPGSGPGVERLVYYVLFPALLFRSLAAAPFAPAAAGRWSRPALVFTLSAMALSALARPLFGCRTRRVRRLFPVRLPLQHLHRARRRRPAGRRAGPGAREPAGRRAGADGQRRCRRDARARARRFGLGAELARNPLVLATRSRPRVERRRAAAAGAVRAGARAAGRAPRCPWGCSPSARACASSAHALPLPALAWFHAVKLLAMPAIAFAVARALALSPLETQVAITQAAVPTATSAYILAVRMNGRGAPVALIVVQRNPAGGVHDAVLARADRRRVGLAGARAAVDARHRVPGPKGQRW